MFRFLSSYERYMDIIWTLKDIPLFTEREADKGKRISVIFKQQEIFITNQEVSPNSEIWATREIRFKNFYDIFLKITRCLWLSYRGIFQSYQEMIFNSSLQKNYKCVWQKKWNDLFNVWSWSKITNGYKS